MKQRNDLPMPFLASLATIWYAIYCVPFAIPRLRIAFGAVPQPSAYFYAPITWRDWIGIVLVVAFVAYAWAMYGRSLKRWKGMRALESSTAATDHDQWPPKPHKA